MQQRKQKQMFQFQKHRFPIQIGRKLKIGRRHLQRGRKPRIESESDWVQSQIICSCSSSCSYLYIILILIYNHLLINYYCYWATANNFNFFLYCDSDASRFTQESDLEQDSNPKVWAKAKAKAKGQDKGSEKLASFFNLPEPKPKAVAGQIWAWQPDWFFHLRTHITWTPALTQKPHHMMCNEWLSHWVKCYHFSQITWTWLGAFQVQKPREGEDRRLRNSLEMMQVGDCHDSHCIRNYAGQY